MANHIQSTLSQNVLPDEENMHISSNCVEPSLFNREETIKSSVGKWKKKKIAKRPSKTKPNQNRVYSKKTKLKRQQELCPGQIIDLPSVSMKEYSDNTIHSKRTNIM